jgi:hypothetical protein
MRLFRPSITAHAHCDLPCDEVDSAEGQKLLDLIAEIERIFRETKQA